MNIVKNTAFGLLAAGSLFAAKAEGQIWVKIRPPVPDIVITRPVPPSPRHVWVQEDWRYYRGRYDYRGGYWAAPPRDGYRYHPGHWRHHPRKGYIWVEGRWRKR